MAKAGRVQHWKHGWIPISPEAKAFAAGKGPRPGARPMLAMAADYRGNHRAPGPDDTGAPMYAMDSLLPADIYDRRVQERFYGTGFPEADRESFAVLNAAKGQPDKKITVYRAVPNVAKEISSGDWVTASRTYAQTHLDGPLYGKGKIISRTVPAYQLFGNGDSINELGWHDVPKAEVEELLAERARRWGPP